MSSTPIGVAVIGAGMAGRAHAAGYRTAPTAVRPGAARRPAASRSPTRTRRSPSTRRGGSATSAPSTSWQAIAEADDIDVVSVVVANSLHREIVEGLLAAGKHVLCEKPLAPTVEDAEAMVAAAAARRRPGAGVGFTFRRSPGHRRHPRAGRDGDARRGPSHFNGRYWCDYALQPDGADELALQGRPGHRARWPTSAATWSTSAEFLCGPMTSASAARRFTTTVNGAPGAAGRGGRPRRAPRSATSREPVENEDIATFTATFANGAVGTFSVSRVAPAMPTPRLRGVRRGRRGHVRPGPARRSSATPTSGAGRRDDGYRQVLLGPAHPYLTGGLPMDFPGVGYGQNDLFAFQARAFLEQVAGLDGGCPRCRARRRCTGLHNMEPSSLAAAAVPPLRHRPAAAGHRAHGIDPAPHCSRKDHHHEARRLQRLPARQVRSPEALKILADLGLTGVEINSGGFLPPAAPARRDLLRQRQAREDYLGEFAAHGIDAHRPELQRQPAAPRPRGADHARRGHPSLDRAGGPARRQAGGHHVRHCPAPTPARTRAGVEPAALGQRLPGRAGLPVGEVAVPFWKDIQALAADADVKVAIEMHPQQHRLQPRRRAPAGRADRRHPRRRGDGPEPPVLAGDRPGRWPSRTSARWSSTPPPRTPGSTRPPRSTACWTTGSPRIAAEEPRIGLGGGAYARTGGRSSPRWDFVAVGKGHDVGVLDRVPARAAGGRPRHAGQHRARGHRARPARGPAAGRGEHARGRSCALTMGDAADTGSPDTCSYAAGPRFGPQPCLPQPSRPDGV